VPTGRVIFEIGGVPIREELARDGMKCIQLILDSLIDFVPVLRIASAKLPTQMEFISKSAPPRLGNMVLHPPRPAVLEPPAVPEGVAVATVNP